MSYIVYRGTIISESQQNCPFYIFLQILREMKTCAYNTFVMSNTSAHILVFLICISFLFSQAKSVNVNPSVQAHLPFSHTPEILLPVHCSWKLQNTPKGTVSEMINDDNINAKKK